MVKNKRAEVRFPGATLWAYGRSCVAQTLYMYTKISFGGPGGNLSEYAGYLLSVCLGALALLYEAYTTLRRADINTTLLGINRITLARMTKCSSFPASLPL